MGIESRITKTEYIKILDFYKVPIPSNPKDIKHAAESILSNKLCRCIKKVSHGCTENEARAIGICTRGIFNKKGLKRGRFTCKKKRSVIFEKKTIRKTKKSKAE